MIQPGTYRAKMVDCGFKKNQSGNDMMFVTFETFDGERINWFGHMQTKVNPKSGKSALMISIETLLKLGFRENWDAFATSASLDVCFENSLKEWELVIEDEVYNGKTYTKVKWINDPEAPRGPKRMESREAVSLVNSMNLKGLTMKVRAEMAGTTNVGQAVVNGAPAPVNPSHEDIPF